MERVWQRERRRRRAIRLQWKIRANAGLYRKLYPVFNQSVYEAGRKLPVFQVEELTPGIVICNDSNYFEPARLMAAQRATALFVPTNNGLPPKRVCAELVAQARNVDIARAVENSVWVHYVRRSVFDRGSYLTHPEQRPIDRRGTHVTLKCLRASRT